MSIWSQHLKGWYFRPTTRLFDKGFIRPNIKYKACQSEHVRGRTRSGVIEWRWSTIRLSRYSTATTIKSPAVTDAHSHSRGQTGNHSWCREVWWTWTSWGVFVCWCQLVCRFRALEIGQEEFYIRYFGAVKVNREDSIQIVGYSFYKDFIIRVNTHPVDWMLHKYVLGTILELFLWRVSNE